MEKMKSKVEISKFDLHGGLFQEEKQNTTRHDFSGSGRAVTSLVPRSKVRA